MTIQSGAAGQWSRPVERRPSVTDTTLTTERFGFPFFLFCVTLFVLIGRPQDYMPGLVPFRPALVCTVLTLMVTWARSRVPAQELLKLRETRLYLLLYAAMIGSIPFSVYRPDSFEVVILQYIVNIVFFFLFLVHVTTLARFKRVATVLALSLFIFTLFGFVNGEFVEGRYSTGGLMYDPNDVAFVELSLLAFAVWILIGPFGVVLRALALAAVLSGILLTLFTASRGGLLGLVIFFLLFLWIRVPTVGKSFKAIVAAAILVAVVVNTDKLNLDRYRTLTSIEDDYNFEEFGRADIWERAIRLFLARPLTGVGVNGFPAAIGTMRQDEKLLPRWQTAHNSYLLILTETGIIGGGAFVLLIFTGLKTFNRGRRAGSSFENTDLASLSGLLLIGFIAQLVAAMFLSQAYSMFFTLAFALSGALNRMADRGQTVPTTHLTWGHR
jgi:O-antigen ligase